MIRRIFISLPSPSLRAFQNKPIDPDRVVRYILPQSFHVLTYPVCGGWRSQATSHLPRLRAAHSTKSAPGCSHSAVRRPSRHRVWRRAVPLRAKGDEIQNSPRGPLHLRKITLVEFTHLLHRIARPHARSTGEPSRTGQVHKANPCFEHGNFKPDHGKRSICSWERRELLVGTFKSDLVSILI